MDEEQQMNAAVNEDRAYHERKGLAASEFAAKNGKMAADYGDTPVAQAALIKELEESLAKYGLKIIEAD